MRRLTVILASVLWLFPAGLTPAQESVEERLKKLEERLKRAEDENRKLREEMEKRGVAATTVSGTDQKSLDAAIERALQAQAGEAAPPWRQVTSASGNPIQFYGFIRLDAHYNTARPVPNDFFLMWVWAEDGVQAAPNDASFVLQARWSRLGLNVNAGEIIGADTTGKIEMDFANYVNVAAESRAPIRIRLAYMNFDWGGWWARFGQDWDVVSPLFPSVHLSGLLWNVGNLGDRRPQAIVGYKAGEDVQFNVTGGIGLTGAIDNRNLDLLISPSKYTSQDIDGFDSAIPGLQLRVGVKGKHGAQAGIWGLMEWLETDNRFGGENRWMPYGIGGDLLVPFGDFYAKGEIWWGQALSDFRGCIGQSINRQTGQEIRSYGGWAELGWQASAIHTFVAGAGFDNPHNRDLTSGQLQRALNQTYYVGWIQNWGGGFKTGFETMYWSTDWFDQGLGTMVRINAYTQLNF